MISVTLTSAQIELAKRYAKRRNDNARAAGKRDAHGATWSDDYRHHLTGSLAETIFLCGMGIDEPILTLDTYKSEPDIAPGLVAEFPDGAEIRGRNYSSSHPTELIIRPDDDPNLPYVLVIVGPSMGQGLIKGWIKAQDAMDRADWFHTPNTRPPAWFVPDASLVPIGVPA